MPTKKDKSYQIRLQCEKCKKFIDIDLHVKMTERDRYGRSETYSPIKIPEYLNIIFDQGRKGLAAVTNREQVDFDRFANTMRAGSSGIQNPLPDHDYEPIIVCKTCRQIKKLKE